MIRRLDSEALREGLKEACGVGGGGGGGGVGGGGGEVGSLGQVHGLMGNTLDGFGGGGGWLASMGVCCNVFVFRSWWGGWKGRIARVTLRIIVGYGEFGLGWCWRGWLGVSLWLDQGDEFCRVLMG